MFTILYIQHAYQVTRQKCTHVFFLFSQREIERSHWRSLALEYYDDLFFFLFVENTSTHQKLIVPKISLGLMSTILSPHSINETEQQSFTANSISFFFSEPRGPQNSYSKRGFINMTSCNNHECSNVLNTLPPFKCLSA